MKTYVITELDIDRLQEIFSMNNKSWGYNSIMNEWVETLKEGDDTYYCECTESWENHQCPCTIKN
jgi:hypothetical protein